MIGSIEVTYMQCGKTGLALEAAALETYGISTDV